MKKNPKKMENEVLRLLKKKGYKRTECVNRRVHWYKYEPHTQIKAETDRIIITTELNIKEVFNTLIIYPNGNSEVKIDFKSL